VVDLIHAGNDLLEVELIAPESQRAAPRANPGFAAKLPAKLWQDVREQSAKLRRVP